MKFIISFIASVFLLTSCGANTPEITASKISPGEVVSCKAISTDAKKTSGTSLQCLDANSSVILESIQGPALINVWGSWCRPCRQEMPFLRALAATGKVQIIGIDIEEANMESARKFVIEQGMTWPNLFDKDGSTKSAFGMGVPVTWFIDSTGAVVHKHIGPFASAADIEKASKKYLGTR